MIRLAPHILAGGLALIYAWFVSRTALRETGLQFITPVLLMIATHVLWQKWQSGLTAGYAVRAYGRSFQTALGLVAAFLAGTILLPQPAQADVGDAVGAVLMVLFCVFIILVIAAVVLGAFYLLFKMLALLFGGNGKDGDDSTTRDVASLAVAGAILVGASLEGVPQAYSWASEGRATATVQIAATPERIWKTLQTATSPAFDLPAILHNFPQPVAVTMDEGTVMGAKRVVAFAGREGAGELHLEVTQLTPHKATFTVLSDTTPYATWIGHQTLTYHVVPAGDGATLSVTLAYERRLAPAWAFGPMMKGAAYLGMDVLARDVKTRAELKG